MKMFALGEKDWREKLTSEEFRIRREEGTERAFSSSLHANKEKGVCKCAGCGTPLFK